MAQIYPGSACVERTGGERVSGGLGSAFGSMIGAVSNVSLGIPETDATRNLSEMNGMMSKAYYREYAIPTDIPTTLRMGFQGVPSFYTVGGVRYAGPTASCSGAVSFTPAVGKDYEVGFSWHGRVCRIGVNEVVVNGDEVRLEPVPIVDAPKC